MKKQSISEFTEADKKLYPIVSVDKKYPSDLVVLQNAFWHLRHEKPLKDDILKLLMFFSPKVRLSSNPNEESTFSITAREYSELTGIGIKGAYSSLERVVDALYNHSVVFYHEERGDVRTRLVTSSGYKDARFTVSFTHFALNIMYVFNQHNPFTKLQIKSIAGLNSHSLKLYPFLVQNQYKQSFDIAIDDLKKALNIDAESYSDYKEFKKNVLKPHILLINLKTEITVQFHAVKKDSRKATHVNFTISKKKNIEQIKEAKQPQLDPVKEALNFVIKTMQDKQL